MRNIFSKLALTAAFMLAMTFTLSCSSGDDDNGGGGSSSPSGGGGDTFVDIRDNKSYKSVKIGNQTWMAENLNYKAEGSNCYDDNDTNCGTYGRLYDRATADTACPPNWHLPDTAEWKTLIVAVGGRDTLINGSSIQWLDASTKLRATSGWDDDYNGNSGNGTNNSGFTARPGGECAENGTSCLGIGRYGYWRTSTEESTNNYIFCMTTADRIWVETRNLKKQYSVRCVKD